MGSIAWHGGRGASRLINFFPFSLVQIVCRGVLVAVVVIMCRITCSASLVQNHQALFLPLKCRTQPASLPITYSLSNRLSFLISVHLLCAPNSNKLILLIFPDGFPIMTGFQSSLMNFAACSSTVFRRVPKA